MKILFLSIPLLMIVGLVDAQPITGIMSIPGDYPTIQLAIVDLNNLGVGSGGVIFNIAANHTEILATSTSGLITATGNADDTIVFRKDPGTAGNNPKITAFTPGTSTSVDGMIIITGGDHITFDGVDLEENPANNNVTKMMEWGYALVKRQNTAPIDGCQHVTIRNCSITLNKTNMRSYGIYAGNHIRTVTTSLTLNDTTDACNHSRFYGNTISNVFQGIALKGYGNPWPGPYILYDHYNMVGVNGVNNISNFGGPSGGASYYAYGIFCTNQEYLQVGNNMINGGDGTTRFVYGIYLSGSYNATADVFSNDVTLTSGSDFYPITGIYVGYGGEASGNTINIHDNSIHNCSYSVTTTSGNFYGISQLSHTTNVNIYNNDIFNNTITGTGNFFGIEGMDDQVTYLNIYNNQIHDNQKSGIQGTMYGIFAKTSVISVYDNAFFNNSIPSSSGTTYPSIIYGYYNNEAPTIENYYSNSFYNLSIGGSSTVASSIFGIYSKSASGSIKYINNNDIYDFTISNPGGGTTTGIKQLGGNNISIYQNEIYDLSSGASAGISHGIHIQSGTTVNLYNNLVSGLTTPESFFGGAIKGIYLEGGVNINLYFNTVFLNATSSTVNQFGTIGIYAGTSPVVNLRNNLIINLSTPVHITNAAYTTAYYRGGTSLTNYAFGSDNNCFYAGIPGPYNLVFYNGTTGYQVMADYQSLVTPRDAQSFSELPPFLNGTSPPYDLHLNTSIPTGCESGGTIISNPLCYIDVEGDPRYPQNGYAENPSCPATAPDVGADEIDGIQSNLETWTGTVSGDWGDPGNWNPVMVPGSGNSVVIPAGTDHQPQVITGNQTCKDLIILYGGSVTITGGFQLFVNGHTLIRE